MESVLVESYSYSSLPRMDGRGRSRYLGDGYRLSGHSSRSIRLGASICLALRLKYIKGDLDTTRPGHCHHLALYSNSRAYFIKARTKGEHRGHALYILDEKRSVARLRDLPVTDR